MEATHGEVVVHGARAKSAPRLRLRPSDPQRARELGAALGVSASVAQVLLHRGIDDVERAR
ncbi:MAG TPA: hypothetical protein VIL20_10305, partial [Sandaracinaceae bacterium]